MNFLPYKFKKKFFSTLRKRFWASGMIALCSPHKITPKKLIFRIFWEKIFFWFFGWERAQKSAWGSKLIFSKKLKKNFFAGNDFKWSRMMNNERKTPKFLSNLKIWPQTGHFSIQISRFRNDLFGVKFSNWTEILVFFVHYSSFWII